MQNLEYHSSFQSVNCPAANGKNVGVMGAGVVSKQAIDFFTSHGMQVAAGAVGAIGISGGYGQGGGHGALGPKVSREPCQYL